MGRDHPRLRLRVMTYNIHRAIGTDRRFRPERVAALLRRYDADLVLLQEVDVGVPRSRMMDLAAHFAHELGYPHRAEGMNVFYRRGRYGNVTLSKHPIGRQRNIDLTLGVRKGRGAQHTRMHVDTPAGPFDLDVFNIHLSLTARMRARQVAHLLASDDIQRLDPKQACVIAGDMNDWRGLLTRPFHMAGFRCASNANPNGHRPIKTYPSFAPAGGLDRVFYRGSLRPVLVFRSALPLAVIASDHLPLIVDFEVV